MATRDNIKRALLKMRYLPNSPLTDHNIENLVNVYEEILADLTPETLEAASRQYLSTDTFFPSPGKLRETALELQMLAIGIPTPGEAWGMVITNRILNEPVFCEEGARLRDDGMKLSGGEYQMALADYGRHVDECPVCDLGGFNTKYKHPAVTETVRLLGGRDAILTDNEVADRARFLEAYREVIARERMKVGMLPEVKEFVQAKRAELMDGTNEIKQLTERLSTR